MKKSIIGFLVVFLSGCFSNSEPIYMLPKAQLAAPYWVKFRLVNSPTSDLGFRAEFSPADSGLTMEPANEWYSVFIISGTPKVTGDITVKVHYALYGGTFGFFEQSEQMKLYKIKVDE